MNRNRSRSPPTDEERDLERLSPSPLGMEDGGMASVIGVMNELYSVGLRIQVDGNLNLPMIVVCGSQSSGKSSVLESISLEEFLPRGVDIQTRCPIVLQLIHTNDGSKWVEFPNLHYERFTDMNEVKAKIQQHNQEIIDSKQVVSEEPLMIRLYSPSVPNLTICDLPGLVENPTAEQPPDLVEKINSLVKNYISNKNSIILAVSAATSDIADSKAIRMAREVDPEGKRTLGVLTKLDLMDKGTNAADVLQGRRIKLDLGILGVVNRGYLDVQQGKSLEAQLETERQFLETHYPTLADSNGIPYLINRISALLMKSIRDTIPKLKCTVQRNIHEQQDILENLGPVEKEEKDKTSLLLKQIHIFSEAFKAEIDGRSRNLNLTCVNTAARIKAIFDLKLGLEFDRFVVGHQLTNEMIKNAIYNSLNLASIQVSHDVAFQELAKGQVAHLKPYAMECAVAVYLEMQKAIGLACKDIKKYYPRLVQKIEEVALLLIHQRFLDCQSYLEDYVSAESSIARTIKDKFRDRCGCYVNKRASSSSASSVNLHEGDNNGKAKVEEYHYVGQPETSQDQDQSEVLPLEKAEVHIANVRKEVTEYVHTVKLQIMESVARGIVYKLVYGSVDQMYDFLTDNLHRVDNPEYLLANAKAEEVKRQRQEAEQRLAEYKDTGRVVAKLLEKVETMAA